MVPSQMKAQAGLGSQERKPQDSELNKLIPFRQIGGSKTYDTRTEELQQSWGQ